jgi:hypothetical protein
MYSANMPCILVHIVKVCTVQMSAATREPACGRFAMDFWTDIGGLLEGLWLH